MRQQAYNIWMDAIASWIVGSWAVIACGITIWLIVYVVPWVVGWLAQTLGLDALLRATIEPLEVEVEPDRVLYSDAETERWLRAAEAAAVTHARQNGSVTVDDIYKAVPPPDNVDGRKIGSIWKIGWQDTGDRVRSERGRNANRMIVVWRLVQETADAA